MWIITDDLYQLCSTQSLCFLYDLRDLCRRYPVFPQEMLRLYVPAEYDLMIEEAPLLALIERSERGYWMHARLLDHCAEPAIERIIPPNERQVGAVGIADGVPR